MSIVTYWHQLGLDIDGEAAGDQSGVHVSLSSDGRSVAIGGWLNDGTGNESGHVRIYRLDGSDQWVQVGLDIDGEAVGDRSGYALSLSDDGKTVAIGAYKNDGNGANSGHVRIYQLNEIDEWVQVGADIDGDADHSSGFDLSLTGDGQTVVIGPAPVRVYKLNESNQWLQVGSDIAGDANSRDGLDGHSVSISSDGRTLATGAPYDDSVATNAGRARIFRLNDVDEWVQLGADFYGDTAEDQLGWNVTLAADGQTVAVGSPGYDGSANDAGRVQIYRLNDIDEWVQVGDDLYGENAGDKLGLYKTISLSDDGKTVALGGRHNDGNGDDSGHVRIYQLNDSSQWVQLSVDIDGEAAGDQFGSSVSLSSDGRTVAIGAVENDGSGDNAGHVRVYQLKQDYGASFDLASIDASSGSTLSRTGLGPYISGGGDFNGDGIDDLVFSAEGITHTGEVVVVFGLSEGFPESVDLSTLDGTNGFVMSGIDAHDGLNPASFIGDFNGDGLDDLVLGAAAADQPGATTAGEAYIVYGQSTVSSGSLDLAGLDGTNGFTFRGIASHQHGDRVGSFVSDAGDVNNDGFDDVLITAAYGDNLGGAAYLLYGTGESIASGNLNTNEVDGTNGYVIKTGSGFTGITQTASLGDVNGDGVDDLLIGAAGDSPGGVAQGGSAFVVYGNSSFAQTEVNLSALDGVNGFSISNYDTSDYFGYVGKGGDFNGDGLNDIIIGAHLGDPDSSRENAGEIYLIYGSNSRVDATVDLDALDGSNGFVINGIDASDMAGMSVSIPGDFNDDGFADLLISAGGADPNGNSNAGEVYLVYGSDSLTSSSLELSSLDGTNGTVFKGVDADDFIGRYAPSAGDYNSDGVDDIVISTHSGGGEAYVVYGLSSGSKSDSELVDDTVDTIPPAFVSSEVNPSGQIVLTYDEDLDVTTISPSLFTVTTGTSTELVVSSVGISGQTVVLTLESPIQNDQEISVTYTHPDDQFQLIDSASWQQIGADINGEAADDNSGSSISLSSDGRIVAIGGQFNDGNGNESGHVRIYRLDGTDQWVQVGLDIDGSAEGDRAGFGNSVSLSSNGEIVAVGSYAALDQGSGVGTGHVRIYQLDASDQWQQLGSDIDGEALYDESGISVSLSDDGQTVAIGAHRNDGTASNGGHVRIYQLDDVNQWVQIGSDIDGEIANGYSGRVVSLSSDGQTVAIGALGSNSETGQARVYRLNETNEWVQLGQSLDGAAANSWFGSSIALSSDGNVVAIGANRDDSFAQDSGQVKIYALNESNEWEQLGQDIDGEVAGDFAGESVSLSADGQIVAIGAHGHNSKAGHVRIYQLGEDDQWLQVADIDGQTAGDNAGVRVSLSDDGHTVAIGASGNDAAGNNAGHVRVYQVFDTSAASEENTIRDPEGNEATSLESTSVPNQSDVGGTSPTFSNAEVTTDGRILLHYDQDLSATTADTSSFNVSVNSFWRDPDSSYQSVDVSNVSTSGSTVELSLNHPVENDQAVLLDYNDPSVEDDAYAVQDPEGNDASSLASLSPVNHSTLSGTAPSLVGGTTAGQASSNSILIETVSSQEVVSAIDSSISNGYSADWADLGIGTIDTDDGWERLSNGSNIIDGGDDMYDKGNIINTDLASNLYYNYDLLQEDSSHFGVGSRHKIFHGTSFWMLAVENSQAAYVEITGDTGADGGGVVTTSNFELGDYKVFVKHINDERKNDPEMSEYTDPSINHIFIVKNTGNHVQDYVNDTNNDYHRISGFESGEDFVYTLIAGDRGYQYSRDELESIASTIIDASFGPSSDDSSTITLNFDQELGDITPPVSAFEVEAGGVKSVASISISGSDLTLELNEDIKNDDAIRVTYTDPGADGLQDPEGNTTASFESTDIDNLSTVPGTPPVFVSAEANSSGQIVLTYNEELDDSPISSSAFDVTVDSYPGQSDSSPVSVLVSSVEVSGQTVILTLETPVENDQSVTVSYTNSGTSETVSVQRTYAQFDGIDNTLETAVKPIPATGDFTVSVWVQTDSSSLSGFQEIFSQGASGNAFYLGTFDTTIRVGDSWHSTGHIYPTDGEWHNLQVTVSSEIATLYLDGVELGQQSNFVNPSGGTDLIIGRQYGDNTEYWDGGIDDLIIFDRALSVDELHDVREGHQYFSPEFHIEFDGDFTATYQNSSITATSASLPTLSTIETTDIEYPIRDPQGNDADSLSEQSDEWSVVYATGSYGDTPYDESFFNDSFRATPNHIVKRECDGCQAGYEEIYYKRLTHVDTFNVGYVLVDSWMSEVDGLPNILGQDFNLYSTYEDALAGSNAWSYCNYDDPGVGFPRDCGIDGAVGSQWNSLTRGGQPNIRFSTEPADDAGIVVTNNSEVIGTAPTFLSAETTTDGRILLHYSEELGDTTAPNSAFTVSTNGTSGSVELYSDSFSTSDSNGWNSTARYNLNGEQLFGRFAQHNTINRTIALNGGAATISFDFYRLDSWDGESFIIRGNGEQIFSRSFRYNTNLGSESGSSSSGTFEYSVEPLTSNTHLGSAGWTDQKLRFTITVPAGLADLDLEFTSTLNQAADDESWAIDNFVVEADGTSVSSVSNSGSTVELTLSMPIENDQEVTVAYTDPSASDDLNATQDPDGNDVDSFAATDVLNNSTVAGTPPSLSSGTTSADGFSILLSFDQDLFNGSLSASEFAVTAGGSKLVDSVVISGASEITLHLNEGIKNDEEISVVYTGSGGIQDPEGNATAGFDTTDITNVSSIPGTPPVFVSAEANSSGQIVLTYNEDLGSTTASTSDFVVTADSHYRVDGSVPDTIQVNSAAVSGSTVVLTLANPIENDQAVTVAYNHAGTSVVAQVKYTDSGEPLEGNVEFPAECNQNGWHSNYVGINLDFYQANDSDFAVGTKVEIAGYDYWIDAMNIPGNCNQGVALIYVADSPENADGDPWSIGGSVVQPVVPGDQWRITEDIVLQDDVDSAIQDPQGNDALSLAETEVTNNSTRTGTAPTFTSAETTTDGRVLVHYSEELSSTAAPASAFDVSANSFWRDPESTYQRVSVSSVSVDGSSIELTLTDPLENDQKVKFAYTDPSGGNDGSAVQDPEGNDVASIDAISLDNISTLAGTSPMLPSQQSTGQFSSDFIESVSSSESVAALNSAITNGYSTNWSGSYYISDGGSDMYDHGNKISTNLASNLYYNYNSLQSNSSHFGSGSRHKIFHGTSFWMLAVENSQATRVQIDGNNGADGRGSVRALNFERGDYKVFIKHVNDGRSGDPSINHIFIVKNTGNHTQDYATNTDNDYHRISGFEPGEDFIYTLVAGNRGYQYSQEQYEGIVDAILDAAGAGGTSGVVGGNGATDFEVSEDGLSLVVHFNEELHDSLPSPDQFSISHAGFEYGARSNTVTSLFLSGSELTLNLAEPIRNDEPITLTYNDPTLSNDAAALQDLEGNDVPTFTTSGYLNLSRVPGTAPLFETIETTTDGRIVLTYDQPLDASFSQSEVNESGFRHPLSDSINPTSFTVNIDSASIEPTSVAINDIAVDGQTVTLTLSDPIENDQLVSLAYLDPTGDDDTSAIQDPQGNDALSLPEIDVANLSTVPGTAPTFERIETTSDGRILLHYSEPLSASVAATSRFEVIVNSHWRDGDAHAKSVAVSNVSTSGNTVELLLSSPVENDQTVTVAYTDPSGGNDGNAIQDPAGNDVLSLATTTVTNSSTVPGTLPVVPVDEVFEVSADGLSIVLPFSERLSGSLPSVDQFSVSHLGFEYGAGSNEVTALAVDDKDLTLTLSQPIRNDQPVTLSYSDPTSANDAFALQDPEGNDVLSFSINRYLNLSEVPGTAPAFQGAVTTEDGRIVLTYDQPLDSSYEAAENFDDGFRNPLSSLIAPSAFEVSVNSPAIDRTIVPVDDVVVDGATVTLTLRDAVENDHITTVAYTDPSDGNDTTALQDRQGNDVSSLPETSVTNLSTVPGTAPTFVSTSVSTDGRQVELLFSEPLGSTTADDVAYEVVSGELIKSITDVAVSGSSITLTLQDPINEQQDVVVSYVDPSDADDAKAIQDPAGNDVLSIGDPLINMSDVVSQDGFTVVSNLPDVVTASNNSTVEGDGLIEGTPETGYKFISDTNPVLFVNRLRQRLHDDSSGDWDVLKAKQSDSGFDVLIHGIRSSDPWYMHWTTDSFGRLSEMGEWIHIDEMADRGLEQAWDTDFDGNGVIGQASLQDSDGNGLADYKLRYTAIDGGSGVVLKDLIRRPISEHTSPAWDVIHAEPTDRGFEVLIVGESPDGKRFSKRRADEAGRIRKLMPSLSEWRTGEQMMRAGEESVYGIDFNEDQIIGPPPVYDNDGDGFVDGSDEYRLFREGADVALVNKKGRGLSDATNSDWDATTAVVVGDGYSVLLEGENQLADRYLVWDVGADGVIQESNGWYNGKQMMKRGYESLFNRDFDEDGQHGEPAPLDEDGDGFVDGSGEYRLFRNGAIVALTDRRGRGLSDSSSGVWDATTAIADGDGFDVLLEGSGRYANRYLIWNVDSEGVIQGNKGWFSADQMMKKGYEVTFDRDFNEDTYIGEPPVLDDDGDGFVDGGGDYRLFLSDEVSSASSSAQASSSRSLLQVSPGRTHQEWRNLYAFAALKEDGSVITWGGAGGDSSSVSAQLQSGVSQIFSAAWAFAALKEDGSVITWGDSYAGGDSSNVSSQLQSGVSQISSNYFAFAALKEDGSVITWGNGWGSGNVGGDSSSVSSQLQSGVAQIFSTYSAFAALKEDGSVITWGDGGYGGDSSSVSAELQSGVAQIFSNRSSFAALKEDGSVITWGDGGYGGDSSSVSAELQSGVAQIFSNRSSFAALKEDGSVITWGDAGGDSSSVSAELQSGVSQIFSSGSAFSALKEDGSVITWGSGDGGDSSSVSPQLQSGVSQIISNYGAFAALKEDGSVITWGESNSGGDSSSVSAQLQSGVSLIISNQEAFAALKEDGSVITWGDSHVGGDSSSVSSALQSGVAQIFSNEVSFAALKEDGSVITWGSSSSGGDSSSVSAELQSGVVGIASPFHTDIRTDVPVKTGTALTLTDRRGRTYSDASTSLWDATTAIADGDGFNVLLEGSGRYANRYLIWNVDSEGVIQGNKGWFSADQMMKKGYEAIFDRDFNEDTYIGEPPVLDDDGDGFVDGGGDYRLFRDGVALELTDRRGRTYSDASTSLWDATAVIADDDGFNVLLEGSGRYANRYLIWEVDAEGVIQGNKGWFSANQMMKKGYETSFDRDFNEDTYIGEPPVLDDDGDGFVDGGGDYRLFRDGVAVELKDRRGRTYSDASTSLWDATKVIDDGDDVGFNVLLEGSGRYANRYMIWDVGADGVITNSNGWFGPDQMMANGYETTFDRDFNEDGYIGEPPVLDDDGDGFVDGDGEYRLFSNGVAVELADRRGRNYSDASTSDWDATKAVVDGDAFEVLLEGSGRYANRYLVWDVGSDGVITTTNGWYSAEEMMEEGYETSFERDFNDDGYQGRPPVLDDDGDGFVDGGGDYRLFRDGAAVELKDRRGRTYSDAFTSNWDATTVIADDDGFNVLLEGSGRYANRYLIWEVDAEGVIQGNKGWFSANQMMKKGYETSFDRDFNEDTYIGEPPVLDDDGDGFVDGDGEYRLFSNGVAVALVDRRGRNYSDASTSNWDATKAVVDGDAFEVLLEGSGRYANRYLVWDVGSDGVITTTNGWYSAEEMMEEGYETSFERDFNDDGYQGRPPAFDVDGDGFVDGGGDYRLFRNGQAVQLRHRRGRTYSDASSNVWDATAVIDNGDGFEVLLEGSGRLADQFVVWDVGSDGVITNSNGWYRGDRMLLEGYETSFNRDFNDDGFIGIPPVEDSDGDGLVDGAGAYRLFRDGEAVDLQNRRGRTYSDLSSRRWDVTKAVVTDDGFDVLLEGGGSLTGRYLVWEVAADGVIARSNGWATSDRLTEMGFGDLFT